MSTSAGSPMKPQTRSSTSKIPNANTPRPSLLERGDAAARSGTSRSSGGVAGNLLFGTVNERILKECRDIYVNGDNALCRIAKMVNHTVLPPRQRIIVLLIGNHSAGKSSYINWYIEEHIQRTGVAIETQGFTLVTSGKRRETLKGEATLEVFRRFQALADIDGVVEYLQTEVSTSKQKRFPLVTFIDTPGLVDGGMHYPFDVNKAILWIGNHADLIFVFFDPIGQALCKRTMTLVEKLNEKHADKMRFYLSKADEAGDETDRQRVLMQIVQELCKRPGLNRAGFDMPTIYIPNPAKISRCANQIENSCNDIEKAIDHTVQQTLNILKTDGEDLTERIYRMLAEDEMVGRKNRMSVLKRFFGIVLAFLLAAFVTVNVFVLSPSIQRFASTVLGEPFDRILAENMISMRKTWSAVPEDWRLLTFILLVLAAAGYLYRFFKQSPSQSRMARKKRRQLEEMLVYLQQNVLGKKKLLYQQYLAESVWENAV